MVKPFEPTVIVAHEGRYSATSFDERLLAPERIVRREPIEGNLVPYGLPEELSAEWDSDRKDANVILYRIEYELLKTLYENALKMSRKTGKYILFGRQRKNKIEFTTSSDYGSLGSVGKITTGLHMEVDVWPMNEIRTGELKGDSK